jgi:hypothetical protein
MKRIYSILIGLLLLLPLQGQILIHSNYTLPAPPVSYYSEYDTVYDAFATPPSSAIATIQEALVYSLDTMDFAGGLSVWKRIDVLYIFASHNSTDALINWAHPGNFNADNVSATAFTTSEGFTGDGTADYISTNWIPSSDAINYTQNSATIVIYVRDAAVDPSGGYTYGYYSTTNPNITFRTRAYDENIAHWRVNSAQATYETSTNVATAGCYFIGRTGANDCDFSKNASVVEARNDRASSGLPTAELHILKANGTSVFTTHQVSIFGIINGTSTAEKTAINTVFETFMDALGKGVE